MATLHADNNIKTTVSKQKYIANNKSLNQPKINGNPSLYIHACNMTTALTAQTIEKRNEL